MATYIQNLTDLPVETPLYTPDFNFINSMMMRKSSMYEQGFQQIKSGYDSIANFVPNAEGNSEAKSQYLKQAEEKLKGIIGSDLSLSENVREAERAYSPFWEDDDLVADYYKSKSISQEQQKYNNLKFSTDPALRDQYWEYGARAVDQSLQELRMAKRGDGSISKVEVARFVPAFDLEGYLQKRATEQGMKIVTETSSGGVTRKVVNGNGSEMLWREWAAREMQMNPRVLDNFSVIGSVQFKDQAFDVMNKTGVDYTTAKTMVADNLMQQRKESYTKQYNEANSRIADLKITLEQKKKDLDQRAAVNPQSITQKEIDEYAALDSEYTSLTTNIDTYRREKEIYSNPESREYQKKREDIVISGKSIFAEHARDQFIENFGRSRALNVSIETDVDPVAKFQADLDYKYASLRQDQAQHNDQMAFKYADQNADGSSSGSGSGSGGGSSSKAGKTTMLPLGLDVQSKDPIMAANRMIGWKNNYENQFLNSSASLILEWGKVDKQYIDYLNQVLRTGKYTPSEELKSIHKRLQDQGLIPTNVTLGQTPSRVMGMLYDKAENYFTTAAPSISAQRISVMDTRNSAADRYNRLKLIEADAKEKISKDPELTRVFDKSGFLSREAFVAKELGFKSVADYRAHRADVYEENKGWLSKAIDGAFSTGSEGGRGIRVAQKSKIESAEKVYDKLLEKSQKKMSEIMNPYINEEAAFMGAGVLVTGDAAINAASQAFADVNFREGESTPDGVMPINIKALEEAGASKEQIAKFVSLVRNNPDGAGIISAEVKSIGNRGKASIKFNVDVKKFTDYAGKDLKLESGTLQAIADRGVEVEVNTNLTSIPEFKTEFVATGVDRLVLNKQGQVSAPSFLKKLGLDYTITSNDYDGKYIVRMTYPVFQNGQITSVEGDIAYIDSNTSLATIQRTLSEQLANRYNMAKQQQLNYGQSNTGRPATFGTQSGNWTQWKQQRGIN